MIFPAAWLQNSRQKRTTLTFMSLDVEPVKSPALYHSSQDNPVEIPMTTICVQIDRDRGTPRGATPPTPPGIRVTYHGGSTGLSLGSPVSSSPPRTRISFAHKSARGRGRALSEWR